MELTTSSARAPTAAPVWPPTIIPPILRIISPSPPSAPRPPVSAAIAERISGGSSSASSSGSSASIPPMASTARAAIGIAELRPDRQGRLDPLRPAPRLRDADPGRQGGGVLQPQVGQPDRLAPPCAARLQDARIALGGDRLPATFLARSQLTGPPCQDIRSANWRRASANCCGSPSGPSGPSGPPGRRTPAAAAGSARHVGRASRITRVPVRSPGRPKPKGGSVISAASQAGWKGHVRHVIPGALRGEQPRCQVRQGRSPAAYRQAMGNRRAAVNRAAGRAPTAARPPGDGKTAGAAGRRRHRRGQRPRPCAHGAAGGVDRVGRVIAIDDHRGDATGVTWRVVDVRDPALAGRLAGVDVVVHTDLDLAPDSDQRSRRAFNVRGAQTVLTAAAAGRVGRVVLVTSAMVYGARPDNPVPLAEDAPLGADPDGSVVGDLLEIEQLAQRSPAGQPRHGDHGRPAGRAGRRGHRHPDHQALRGAAAAGGEGLRAALAVLPRRRPGVGAGAGRGGRGDRQVRGRLRRLAGAGAGGGAVRAAPDRAAGRPDVRAPRSGCTGPASPRLP